MLVLAMEFSRRATNGGPNGRSCVETEKWSAPEGRRRLLHPEVSVTEDRKSSGLLPQNGTEILNQYINWESLVSTERLSVLPGKSTP